MFYWVFRTDGAHKQNPRNYVFQAKSFLLHVASQETQVHRDLKINDIQELSK
jgi:hypothetical protein